MEHILKRIGIVSIIMSIIAWLLLAITWNIGNHCLFFIDIDHHEGKWSKYEYDEKGVLVPKGDYIEPYNEYSFELDDFIEEVIIKPKLKKSNKDLLGL